MSGLPWLCTSVEDQGSADLRTSHASIWHKGTSSLLDPNSPAQPPFPSALPWARLPDWALAINSQLLYNV
jgi:hypothetical protein